MSEIKSTVECTCSVCGKTHVRQLLYDIEELNETQKALIKKSVCHECRTRRNDPLGIFAVTESLQLYQEALTNRKLSEDNPRLMFHNSDYIFLDKAVLAVETTAQWPKENPHIPKEAVTNG